MGKWDEVQDTRPRRSTAQQRWPFGGKPSSSNPWFFGLRQVQWYIPQEADRKPGDVNPAMKAMDFHGPAFPPAVHEGEGPFIKNHDKNHGSFSMESNHPGLLVRSWEQGKWSQTFPDRPRIPFLTR